MSKLLDNTKAMKKNFKKILKYTDAIKKHTEYSIYNELEYIQSTGTQYINTKVSANTPIGFEIDFQLTNTSGAFFGARSGSGNNRFGCINYSNGFHMMIANGAIWNYTLNTNRHTASVKVASDYSYTWTFDEKSGTGRTSSGVLVNQNFSIFSNNYDGKCSMKLYKMKMFNSSGEVIRDFVPVQDDNGTIGLYDKITEEFYQNAGTGTFIAGE